MTQIKKQYIPAPLASAVKGGYVTDTSEILDENKGKRQDEINQETDDKIDNIKGGSTKSIADLSEDIANEAERASGVEAGLRESIDELGQIGLDPDNAISTDGDDFDGDTVEKRSKIPTIGAIIDGNPGVYDVSKRNPTGGPNSDGKFTLEYILANANALIPTSRRHGGMEICFVHSNDNKYVQYRCMADEFTTDTTKWAICDDGVYLENPEFAVVFVDSKKRIGYGLKKNGDFYFGAGCPQQVKDYIAPIVTSLLAGIDTKVDKIPNKGLSTNDYTNDDKSVVELERLTENREWLYALLDGKKQLFEGVKIEGKKVIYIPVEIDADFAVSGNINTKSSSEISVYNKEWLYLLMDKLGHIIEGLKKEGRKEVYIDTFFNKIRFLSDESKQDFIDYLDVQIRQELSQLVVDLPVSDGTDIQSGYAYIDSTDRCVKVKA